MQMDYSQLNLGFLLQCILGNRLERLLNVNGLLGGRLKVRDVALALAPGHRPLLRHDPLALLHVYLVAQHDEGEVVRVVRAGLDEELVAPAVERLKAPRVVHVVDQHTAVGSAIERHTERLEPLLARRVPKLHSV